MGLAPPGVGVGKRGSRYLGQGSTCGDSGDQERELIVTGSTEKGGHGSSRFIMIDIGGAEECNQGPGHPQTDAQMGLPLAVEEGKGSPVLSTWH